MSKSKPYPTRDELAEEWVTKFQFSYSLGSGCWNWKRARDGKGYGAVSYAGRVVLAHRMAYIIAHGSIPDGQCVCHACDNPACVRPDHLFLGTHQENMDDRTRKGRIGPRKGVVNGNAKLTDRRVRIARRLHRESGMTFAAIGALFGVSWKTAAQAIKGENWSHVT